MRVNTTKNIGYKKNMANGRVYQITQRARDLKLSSVCLIDKYVRIVIQDGLNSLEENVSESKITTANTYQILVGCVNHDASLSIRCRMLTKKSRPKNDGKVRVGHRIVGRMLTYPESVENQGTVSDPKQQK